MGVDSPASNVPKANLYTIDERLHAGYAQATFAWDRGAVVAGVRFERQRQEIAGFLQAAGKPPVPTRVERARSDWFPNLNLRFDLGEHAVLRGSVQRSTARPSFGEIRTGASISDIATPGTISGGNPLLRPELTWGLDGAFEYDTPGGGLASVSAFARFVDDVLYTGRVVNETDLHDEPGVDRTGYIISSTFNGDRGRLYGVEFAYLQQWRFLPAPWDGFGFEGNLALLGGSFDAPGREGAPFPGTSDVVVNASLFCEKGPVSARVACQWRSDWPDTPGGFGVQGEAGDEFRQAYGNLDVTLRDALSRQVILFADFANLTHATYVVFEDEPAFPVEVERIGRRYLMGVRFDV
ncbi:MAG: TonB-dependent receptor domain-containing protein [Thermaurantiacus tibetensis]